MKVTIIIFQSILSGPSVGDDGMEAVVENVGSLVQNIANNVDDNEDEDYGFTSLLSARNNSVHFPQPYDVSGTKLNNSRNLF